MSCGAGVAVEQRIAALNTVAVLNRQALAARDQILDRFLGLVIRLDRDALLVLVVLAELDRARDFGQDRVVLRTAGFEQFGDARQTAGDVALLGRRGRDTRQHVAGLHACGAIDGQNRIDRQQVAGVAATCHLDRLAALVLDDNRRLQFVAARRGPPIDDNAVGRALHFVGLFAHGCAFDQIFEIDDAVGFRQNRTGVWIPLRDLGAALHGIRLHRRTCGRRS